MKMLLLLIMVSCTDEYDEIFRNREAKIKAHIEKIKTESRDKATTYCKSKGGLSVIDFWTDTFKFSCKDSCAGLEFSYDAEFIE